MKKVDEFEKTGKTRCIRHGIHREWMNREAKVKKKNGKVYYYRAVECKICNRERTEKYRKSHPDYQDIYRFSQRGILTRMLNQASSRANKKNLKFELDIKWVERNLLRQDYKCKYSGIKFEMKKHPIDGSKRPFLPSIDKIEPKKGYTKDNSAIVCTIVNVMKNDISMKNFKLICEKIAGKT